MQINKPNVEINRQIPSDEIDWQIIWHALWAGKWLIVGVTALFTVAAVMIAINLPNIYRSEALVASISPSQRDTLASIAGQFSGLASLSGINIPTIGPDETIIALETLESRSFIKNFIEKHNILPELMAVKNWDLASDMIIFDDKIYDKSSRAWTREVKPPQKAKPSNIEAHEEFLAALNVSQDKNTSLITISIEHYSPVIAKQWVEWLVDDINSYMREQDLREANQSIVYLNKQLASTSIAGMQAIFYRLIEEETKTIMLAQVQSDYMLKTIDPAIVPEEEFKPKRLQIMLLGLFLGGLFGTTTVLGHHFFGPTTLNKLKTKNENLEKN